MARKLIFHTYQISEFIKEFPAYMKVYKSGDQMNSLDKLVQALQKILNKWI